MDAENKAASGQDIQHQQNEQTFKLLTR